MADMDCLPPAHRGGGFYRPVERGYEVTISERLREWRRRRARSFRNISSRSGRMNENRKSPCIRPIGMPTS